MATQEFNLGNPLLVISELRGVARALMAECEQLRGVDPDDLHEPSFMLKRKLYDFAIHIDTQSDGFLEQFDRAIEFDEKLKGDDSGSLVLDNPKIASYVAELDRLVTNVLVVYEKFHSSCSRKIAEGLKAFVPSGKFQWRILGAAWGKGNSDNRLQIRAAILSMVHACSDAAAYIPASFDWASNDLPNDLLSCAGQSREARVAIESSLSGLPYAAMVEMFLEDCRSASDGYAISSDTAYHILNDLDELRSVLRLVEVAAVYGETTEDQLEFLSVTAKISDDLDLAKRRFYASEEEAILTIAEFNAAVEESGDLSEVTTDALDAIADSPVDSLRGVYADKDAIEVRLAFGVEAFKLATIGCGALLETLLREALKHDGAGVRAVAENPDLNRRFFSGNSGREAPNDPNTWMLFLCIEVATRAFDWMDPKLVNHCHVLRKSRNAIHGGVVEREHALLSLKTIGTVWQHVAESYS